MTGFIVGLVVLLFAGGFVWFGNLKREKEALTKTVAGEKTDAALAAQEQVVPTIVPPPAPTATNLTPDQAVDYWNKKEGQ